MTPKLLECTLRDGSYAINFQFSRKFTQEFVSQVDSIGFKYIEVGHGIGIGAHRKYQPALENDFVYGEAASKGAKKSQWGMFAQPHITNFQDLDSLSNLGMGFIRIGVDINNLQSGYELAQYAKSKNLLVFLNYMKSYKYESQQIKDLFADSSKQDYIDGIYLVDSAGGMLQKDIEIQVNQVKPISNNKILGFHGHDNLGLAVSNSLRVAELGFQLIDCTMQGLGRSSGNAMAERLIAIGERSGINFEIDLLSAIKVGETLIKPMISNIGHGGLDTYAGFALFHSSYLDNVIKSAQEYNVDPYKIIAALSSNDGDLETVQEIAAALPKLNDKNTKNYLNYSYFGREQE